MEHPRHNQETYGHFRLNMAPKISNCVATNASKQTNRYLHRHEVTARGRISAAPIMPPRYQDISKISDTLLSGETVPAQVKIVKTAHLGVKQIMRPVPITEKIQYYNAMFRPVPRGKGMSGHNNGVCKFVSCIYGNYQLPFVIPC